MIKLFETTTPRELGFEYRREKLLFHHPSIEEAYADGVEQGRFRAILATCEMCKKNSKKQKECALWSCKKIHEFERLMFKKYETEV